jgi:glycosyltransferase involved in cell wall biosynthesis
MIRIGFDASAKGGPGIFMSRLQAALETMGAFSVDRPDVWLQLSHKPIPAEWLDANKRRQQSRRLLVRTAGGYYARHYLIHKPNIIQLPGVDDWYSRRKNERLNAPIRQALQQADGIVFQSQFTYRMVQQFITPTGPGACILNGVDIRIFSPEPGERRNKKSVDILVSHQFRLHKRLHDVIRTVAHLKTLTPERPLMLHVVGGDGRDAFHYAKQAIAETGMENNVRFWGQQPTERLPEIYRLCDFMIALPLWDPCPNAVVEGVSCGLPVITTEAGGIPEIIGEAGRVITEKLPLHYTDHHHYEFLPRVDIEQAAQEAHHILEQIDGYRLLARERALSTLGIEGIARQYLDTATFLFDV